MKKITILLASCALAFMPISAFATDAAVKKPHAKKTFGFLAHENVAKKYKFVKNTGARWVRPHPGPFVWGEMQTEKGGEIDFTETDAWVQRAQKKNLSILVTLWPYAEWDQENKPEKCHIEDEFADQITEYRCNPKHWKQYRQWVRATVERYDGDGVDDMPGLNRAIRHWEVNNEPDMGYYTEGMEFAATDDKKDDKDGDEKSGDSGEPSDELRFYVGSPKQYKKLLHNTQKPIRNADSNAKVVIAAPSSLNQNGERYFSELFDLKIKKKFDIANVHCISSGCEIPTLNVAPYQELLDEYGINKNIWITEAQAYVSEDPDINAAQLQKSLTAALDLGVKRIIMTHRTFTVPSYEEAGEIESLPEPLTTINTAKRMRAHKSIFNTVQ